MKSINDLGSLESNVKSEIQSTVTDVLNSGWFVLGARVAGFESEFASYVGTSHCVGVANGTEALQLALLAVGIQKGDVVLAVANAGFYGSHAILACGAHVTYVDIEPEDYTMSLSSLRHLLTPKVKAVIVTHLYGTLAGIEEIVKECRSVDIPVIEDCAQAHGATRHGKKAGSFGDIGCFSFYPTKNLGALGDGGAVVCSDPTLYKKVLQLRQYGWGKKYLVDVPDGRNSRLDEIQAAVLSVKLKYLDKWNEQRRMVAKTLAEGITNQLVLKKPTNFTESYVAHLFVIEVEHRASLQAHLATMAVPFDVHYPVPDHRQAVYKGAYASTKLPVTELVSGRLLTLPCFPALSSEDTLLVISAVNSWRA